VRCCLRLRAYEDVEVRPPVVLGGPLGGEGGAGATLGGVGVAVEGTRGAASGAAQRRRRVQCVEPRVSEVGPLSPRPAHVLLRSPPLNMVARSNMYGQSYYGSYSYRLWSLANFWSNYHCEYNTQKQNAAATAGRFAYRPQVRCKIPSEYIPSTPKTYRHGRFLVRESISGFS
jgi:hypothetical protein